MSEQTKKLNQTKTKNQNKDLVTQLKNETAQAKETENQQQEEIDWERNSDEEDETDTRNKTGVVVEQGKVGSNKPKKLGDLFDSEPVKKTVNKSKKQTANKPNDGGELKKPEFHNKSGIKNQSLVSNYKETNQLNKPTFTNSQGIKNMPEQSQPNTSNTTEKRKFENSKGQYNQPTEQKEYKKKYENTKEFLNQTNEANKNIKATKSYLEGDIEVKYKPDETANIEKPKFTNTKKNDTGFGDYDKSQDVFFYLFIFFSFF